MTDKSVLEDIASFLEKLRPLHLEGVSLLTRACIQRDQLSFEINRLCEEVERQRVGISTLEQAATFCEKEAQA